MDSVLTIKAAVLSQAISSQIDKALALQSAGELDAAVSLFEKVLKSDSQNAVALYSMAAIESTRKNYEKALTYIQPVTASHPNFAQAHLAKSVILFNLGQFDPALKAAEKAIRLEPSLQNAKAHLDTVKVAKGMQQPSGQGATALNPEVQALTQKAISLQGSAEHNEAIALLNKAIQMAPTDFAALYSLGISLGATGQKMEALDCFIKATDSAPHLVLGHLAKAQSYADIGLSDDALLCFDKAIEVDPTYTQSYTNKAALLQAINRHQDALLTLIACVEVDPLNVTALEGQGLLLGQFKQFDLSVNAFKRALEIDPNYSYGEGHLMHARLSCCDWTDYEESRQRIFAGIRAGKKMCGPLTIMAITDDAKLARQCIEIYARDKYGEPLFKLWNGEKYAHRRKRVAFMSSDFRNHPVGYLFIELIEKFDKDKFELTGVFTGNEDDSELWKRYRCSFNHYIDAKNIPSLELAKLLRAMEIDIIIDLNGHTEGTRLDVLSHRPAPFQISYLGFPGTLALPFIDYIIADSNVIPSELISHYFEKVLYLPHCYLPRDSAVIPSLIKPSRTDFGLPEKSFIFCCFNHDYKINPPIFHLWMQLLKDKADSVLWLMNLNDSAMNNLKKEAILEGVDPKRLIFATRVPNIEDHLARYQLADVFLDTFPYNGHTTVSDSLYSGLPVITKSGTTFASRVGFSLLNDYLNIDFNFYLYELDITQINHILGNTNFLEIFKDQLLLKNAYIKNHKEIDVFYNNFQKILTSLYEK